MRATDAGAGVEGRVVSARGGSGETDGRGGSDGIGGRCARGGSGGTEPRGGSDGIGERGVAGAGATAGAGCRTAGIGCVTAVGDLGGIAGIAPGVCRCISCGVAMRDGPGPAGALRITSAFNASSI